MPKTDSPATGKPVVLVKHDCPPFRAGDVCEIDEEEGTGLLSRNLTPHDIQVLKEKGQLHVLREAS